MRVVMLCPEVEGSLLNEAKNPAAVPEAAAFMVVAPPFTVKPLAPVNVAEAALNAPAIVRLPELGTNVSFDDDTFGGKLPEVDVTHIG